MAAVVVVEFVVRAWNQTKFILDTEWDFIWDVFAFMLSKASYSAELVNALSKRDLNFNLGKPGTNVCHWVQTSFGAVCSYLLKFKGSIPSPFQIIINGTEYPSDYVANCAMDKDFEDSSVWLHPRQAFYIDESILPSDVDTQGLAGQ
ncbi:hypothetical protein CVT25_007427 [Psilocybe cyanescens]|uniref:Uncharacterized protein n=1 Tax=Psilocybe cyanescens TaxID=93625 RepID=A0A409XIN0_PSICY|nr:hypothetical protein CVT25_007427 [Psilocybe cyanescens]